MGFIIYLLSKHRLAAVVIAGTPLTYVSIVLVLFSLGYPLLAAALMPFACLAIFVLVVVAAVHFVIHVVAPAVRFLSHEHYAYRKLRPPVQPARRSVKL
jgi:hypothetical protein